MDPNVALKRIREIIQSSDWGDASALAGAVEGLDHWIATGGALPDAWKERDPVFPQLRVPLRKDGATSRSQEKEVELKAGR